MPRCSGLQTVAPPDGTIPHPSLHSDDNDERHAGTLAGRQSVIARGDSSDSAGDDLDAVRQSEHVPDCLLGAGHEGDAATPDGFVTPDVDVGLHEGELNAPTDGLGLATSPGSSTVANIDNSRRELAAELARLAAWLPRYVLRRRVRRRLHRARRPRRKRRSPLRRRRHGAPVAARWIAGARRANKRAQKGALFNIRAAASSLARATAAPSAFGGGCVDTGAERTCMGLEQARAYCRERGTRFDLVRSNRRFRFADSTLPALGSMGIVLAAPDGSSLQFQVDVVDAGIPLLLGLDFLDHHGLYAQTVDNILVSARSGWTLPLVRRGGHVFVNFHASVCYNRAEVRKLHRQFHHPSVNKLRDVLCRADPSARPAELQNLLQEIKDNCVTCQQFAPRPLSFRVSLPDACVFNTKVAVDLMFLPRPGCARKQPVLHVIDMGTHFGAARFINGETVDAIWSAFVTSWAAVYSGYPDVVRSDAGSVFTSGRWRDLTSAAGIDIQISGIESHNSLGIGERYHAPLRQVYDKILADFPGTDAVVALQLAVKTMNDSLGPEGLVPSYLVFGTLPRFPGLPSPHRPQAARLQAMYSARQEYDSIVARIRVQRALKSRTASAVDAVYRVGDIVATYRERAKRFVGAFAVTAVQGKIVFVRDQAGMPARPFNSTTLRHALAGQDSSIQSNALPAAVEPDPSSILLGSLQHSIAGFGSNGTATYVTEVVTAKDPRSESPRMVAAKKKEVLALIKRGAFRVVMRDELEAGANILTGRFVLAVKDADTDREVWKARYVCQGHRDVGKSFVVHDSASVQQGSVRLLVALSSILGYRIWTEDVSTAYLQSTTPLLRKVYMDVGKDAGVFDLSPGELLQILRPLYGLCDSGDYWGATFDAHHRDDLGMASLPGDHALYFKRFGDDIGLSAAYVDDTLRAGPSQFETESEATSAKFASSPRSYNSLRFAGLSITATDAGCEINQGQYLDKFLPLPLDASYAAFRSARAMLAWCVNTRPDIAFYVSRSASVTAATFCPSDVRQLNKARARVSDGTGIAHPRLDRRTLSLSAYADASFATNVDKSSQLGFALFLTDGSGNCNLIRYRSYKARRVTRSILGGEVHAFADAFDEAFVLRHDLELMLGQKVPLKMYTDSKSLFDVVTRATYTAERRLMIDVEATRQAYIRRDIDDIGLLASEHNVADGLTKDMVQTQLKMAMNGTLKHPVKQWIVR
jgi:Reverse transcriptase (RNA-dependent DNA polymerase)